MHLEVVMCIFLVMVALLSSLAWLRWNVKGLDFLSDLLLQHLSELEAAHASCNDSQHPRPPRPGSPRCSLPSGAACDDLQRGTKVAWGLGATNEGIPHLQVKFLSQGCQFHFCLLNVSNYHRYFKKIHRDKNAPWVLLRVANFFYAIVLWKTLLFNKVYC